MSAPTALSRSGTPTFLGVLALAVVAAALGAQQVDPSVYAGLRWRTVGPEGNRAIAVVGVPGDPLTAFVGAASGGVWKTEDGGVRWRPTFDDMDAQSIGSLAIAPTAPNEVWAGTGETFIIRPALAMGNGIYKSTDGGETWTHMGLEATGRIGRVVVHPRDHNVVFACAEGHGYGPQKERGIWRTTDGGKTWRQVLFVDEGTGCADLAIDPRRPDILFAGMWSLRIDPWKLDSGGTGGGVYVSRDGGDTWRKISGNGLPAADHAVGKVAVGIAPSDPDRVYALIEDDDPTFYRSDDGGRHWRLMSRNHDMAERPPYYVRFAVDPVDPDRVYFTSVRFSMSRDGGATLAPDSPRGGGDTHDVWVDPMNADRFMVADDGGATITLDRGKSFQRVVLPIAQMYHVHTDNAVPYNLYGNRQDGYSYAGPSNSRKGGIVEGDWHSVGGCESGFAIPDTALDNQVWSGCYDGGLEVYDPRTEQSRNVRIWPEAAYGWPPADVQYRWHWTFPIMISPHDGHTVYVGSQHVHRTRDGGQSWQVVSPDLTLNDKSKQQSSGGKTTDNLMTYDGSVLYALAESPVKEGVIWAGTNDGQLSLTQDGGDHWENLGANLKGVPAYGQISNIEPSRWDAATAYVAVDLHQMADFDPYILETTDYGQTWKRIDEGIERSPFSFVHVVREDPVRKGMLYAGTDNGVWFTLDDGAHWMRIRNNLPAAPAYWMVVQPHFNDLVVATYGRGFWILDDVTSLRALNPEVLAGGPHLFSPRPAYRFRDIHQVSEAPNSNVPGQDPPYGADIDLYLPTGSAGPVKVEIAAPDGSLVRTLSLQGTEGINRIQWNLRYESPTAPRLRTPPPGKPWVPLGEDRTRRLRSWDLDLTGGQVGPLVVPGTYQVRVDVAGQELTTSVQVLKDPHSAGTLADIQAQVALSLQLRGDLNRVGGMIDRLEWVRAQVEQSLKMLQGDSTATALHEAADAFRDKLLDVEGRLFDVHLTGAREDAFRNPMKLYGRLSALASDVGSNGADFPPTDQQNGVHDVLRQRLEEAAGLMDALMQTDLPSLNAKLAERNAPVISDREDRDEER
ncbi:MAG: glycosyl hydrolase [Gemmatimonadetes bacterium]|nr:glycosyl hydrolase [Gemmatimonadota bacterium]